ncbi:hypothetical protein PR048_002395 [Dryococelus australis]|uniref:Uncharacterized protein n=1 Tax=Dryococelus australis TaxID=614101 RepID=A0ABQ9IK34_9NEOP|nr:hypothetical protein PR048_002395 [Dryococelus australis]
MKGRGKREIPEKTCPPAASCDTNPTCENTEKRARFAFAPLRDLSGWRGASAVRPDSACSYATQRTLYRGVREARKQGEVCECDRFGYIVKTAHDKIITLAPCSVYIYAISGVFKLFEPTSRGAVGWCATVVREALGSYSGQGTGLFNIRPINPHARTPTQLPTAFTPPVPNPLPSSWQHVRGGRRPILKVILHMTRAAQQIASLAGKEYCSNNYAEIKDLGDFQKLDTEWSSAGMKGRGETEDPRENPPTGGIVRHDSHLRKNSKPGLKELLTTAVCEGVSSVAQRPYGEYVLMLVRKTSAKIKQLCRTVICARRLDNLLLPWATLNASRIVAMRHYTATREVGRVFPPYSSCTQRPSHHYQLRMARPMFLPSAGTPAKEDDDFEALTSEHIKVMGIADFVISLW